MSLGSMGTGVSSGAAFADTGTADCFAAAASGFNGVADDAEGNNNDDDEDGFVSKDCVFVSG